MTTIQIELRDATAPASRAAGLLTPQALDWMLTDALKRQEAADSGRPSLIAWRPSVSSDVDG